MTLTRFLFPAIFLASAGALAIALIAQYAYGLEPCILCQYQRIPYVAAMGIGAAGTWVAMIDRSGAARLAGLVFLAGAAVAFYHVGVEQHWWQAATACGTAATDLPGDFERFRQGLGALRPAKPCDEVDWSLFGLSMATYNAAASLALAVGCFAGVRGMAEERQS